MTGIMKIIFPTDFSDASKVGIRWVLDMEEKFDAEVYCITCIQNMTILLPILGADLPTMDELRERAANKLEEFSGEYFPALSHPIRNTVLSGRPADEIVNYGMEIGANLIIMATHGQTGLSHLLIGSTTESVVRHAHCPVLSVRP